MKTDNSSNLPSADIYKILDNSALVKKTKKNKTNINSEIEKALTDFLKTNPYAIQKSVYLALQKENIIEYSYTTFWRKYRHIFENAKKEMKNKT